MLSGHLRTFKDIHVRTLEDPWPESWGDGILGESLEQERRNCWTATHTEQIQKHLHPPFLIGQKNLFLANQKWVRVRTRKCRRFEVLFLGHWGRPHESFKAIHNLGPAYLSDLINIRRCSSYNLLCNVGVFCTTLLLSSNVLLETDHLLQLFQRFGTSYQTILGNKVMKTKRFQDRVKCTMANRGVWEEISINAPSFPVVEGWWWRRRSIRGAQVTTLLGDEDVKRSKTFDLHCTKVEY